MRKPLVAVMTATCLMMPATTVTIAPSTEAHASRQVTLAAAVTPYEPPAPSRVADLEPAVHALGDLSGVDTATLWLQLLTAPFHNIYGVSIAVGKAANAVVQLVSLPFSVATFVLTNRTSEIPAYIETVRKNLTNAGPGISAAVDAERAYNIDLLTQLFGGSGTDTRSAADVSATAVTATDPGTLLLQLATIPFHNIYAVSIAVGKAANAFVQLAALPFSIGTFVLTNRTTEVPAYVETVRNNLTRAVPGIADAVDAEIAYNRDLFHQFFGGSQILGSESDHAAAVFGTHGALATDDDVVTSDTEVANPDALDKPREAAASEVAPTPSTQAAETAHTESPAIEQRRGKHAKPEADDAAAAETPESADETSSTDSDSTKSDTTAASAGHSADDVDTHTEAAHKESAHKEEKPSATPDA